MKIITGASAVLASLLSQHDAALGYPRAGIDVGRGIHAANAISVSTHYATVLTKFADGTTLGYPLYTADDEARHSTIVAAAQAKVTAGTATATDVSITLLPAPVAIDATWYPPLEVLP
jgi:hypothetical protein